MNSNKGLTLIELLIVIVVMGIISAFSVVAVGNIINNTKLGVDEQVVGTLNTATSYYRMTNGNIDVFESDMTDAEKLTFLFEQGFVDQPVVAQSSGAAFLWDSANSVWKLNVDGTAVALSPYGDTPTQIVPNIISDIQDRFADKGSYGRSWGEYRYTDVGLEPDDWDDAILHVFYTPSGSKLLLQPEAGYKFTLSNEDGDVFVIKASYNWNLIYDDTDGFWYFKSVSAANKVLFSTLVIEES